MNQEVMVETFMLLEKFDGFVMINLVQKRIQRSDVLDSAVGSEEFVNGWVSGLVLVGQSYFEPSASDLLTVFVREVMVFIQFLNDLRVHAFVDEQVTQESLKI